MVEEASAEEEELLGQNKELEDGEEAPEGNNIVRDEELIKAVIPPLDLVHSFRCVTYQSLHPNFLDFLDTLRVVVLANCVLRVLRVLFGLSLMNRK